MDKSHMNYNLAPERDFSQTDYIKIMLDEIDHVKRKDLIVMCDLIITAPKEMRIEDTDAFFKSTYEFCVDRYGTKSGIGEDCIVSSYVHLDESTPHMHVSVLPIVETVCTTSVFVEDIELKKELVSHRFCAKEFVNRNELRTLHSDMQR